jgi:hypothetical protein
LQYHFGCTPVADHHLLCQYFLTLEQYLIYLCQKILTLGQKIPTLYCSGMEHHPIPLCESKNMALRYIHKQTQSSIISYNIICTTNSAFGLVLNRPGIVCTGRKNCEAFHGRVGLSHGFSYPLILNAHPIRGF